MTLAPAKPLISKSSSSRLEGSNTILDLEVFGVNLAEEVAEGLELLDVVALDFVALGILVLEDGAEDVVFIELDWE